MKNITYTKLDLYTRRRRIQPERERDRFEIEFPRPAAVEHLQIVLTEEIIR